RSPAPSPVGCAGGSLGHFRGRGGRRMPGRRAWIRVVLATALISASVTIGSQAAARAVTANGVAIGDAIVTEPAVGSTVAYPVAVSLLHTATADLTVGYTLQSREAGSADFVMKSGSVRIPSGRQSATISVGIRGDSLS